MLSGPPETATASMGLRLERPQGIQQRRELRLGQRGRVLSHSRRRSSHG